MMKSLKRLLVVAEQATAPTALVSCSGCEIPGKSGFAFHTPRPTSLAGNVFEVGLKRQLCSVIQMACSIWQLLVLLLFSDRVSAVNFYRVNTQNQHNLEIKKRR